MRRARTAVAVGVVAFLAGQALFHHAVRTDRVPVGDPVFAEKFDRFRQLPAFFAATADRPRVIALGSSRTQLGFDAARFADATGTEAFNFGCPAAGPITSALYLRRLVAAGVRAELVFVEVHPCFLTPGDPPFEARWLHAYRLREAEPELLRRLGWDVATPSHHGPRGYVTAFSAYKLAVLDRYWPTMLPCPFGLTVGVRSDPRGFVPGIELPAAERPRALERAKEQYWPVLKEYRVGGVGCAATRDILATCRDIGAKPVLVVTPEAAAFRRWYGPDGIAELDRFAESLGVPVRNARDWVPDAEFADGHHPTPAGAARFTDRLAREFPRP